MPRKRELVYKENPYIQDYATNTKFKRIITSAVRPDGSFEMSLLGRDPLQVKDQGLMNVTTKIVDPTPFIKFKAQAINALYKLNNSGVKIFALLCDLMQGYEGRDKLEIVLSWDLLTAQQQSDIGSKSTFQRGIRDLIAGDFIAPSVVSNLYFVNPKMLYNGDSVIVATQYIKAGTETAVRFTQMSRKIANNKAGQQLFSGNSLQKLTDGRLLDPNTGEIYESEEEYKNFMAEHSEERKDNTEEREG